MKGSKKEASPPSREFATRQGLRHPARLITPCETPLDDGSRVNTRCPEAPSTASNLRDSRFLPSLTAMTLACQGHRPIFALFVSTVGHLTPIIQPPQHAADRQTRISFSSGNSSWGEILS